MVGNNDAQETARLRAPASFFEQEGSHQGDLRSNYVASPPLLLSFHFRVEQPPGCGVAKLSSLFRRGEAWQPPTLYNPES